MPILPNIFEKPSITELFIVSIVEFNYGGGEALRLETTISRENLKSVAK